MEPKSFKLSAPLLTHKGPQDELNLQMPMATSFITYGMPYELKGDEVIFNMPAIFGFLHDMTGYDKGILSGLQGCDVIPLAWAVVGIVGTRPTNGSKSPTS